MMKIKMTIIEREKRDLKDSRYLGKSKVRMVNKAERQRRKLRRQEGYWDGSSGSEHDDSRSPS